jgi:hypothetical protein
MSVWCCRIPFSNAAALSLRSHTPTLHTAVAGLAKQLCALYNCCAYVVKELIIELSPDCCIYLLLAGRCGSACIGNVSNARQPPTAAAAAASTVVPAAAAAVATLLHLCGDCVRTAAEVARQQDMSCGQQQ